MATRVVRKEKAAARLWVFAPPHRLLTSTARLADSTVVGYVALDSGGRTEWGEASIALLPRCPRLEIVFDAGDVFQTTVTAPRLTEAKLRLALPNLLEDRLLAEPAQCHLAFLPALRGGEASPGAPTALPVAVIDRGLLTRLLDVLTAAGERPRAAYSAIYVLPPPGTDALPVFVARGRMVTRTALHAGVACDIDDGDEPPAALRLALQSGGWQRVRAYGPQAQRLAKMTDSLGVPVEVVDSPLDTAAPDGAINLLQGTFARGGMLGDMSRMRLSLRSWKVPLVWSAVAIAVFIAGMNVYWLKLRSEADALRSRMTTAFRSAFADAEMVDPIVQTQRELARLRARAGQASASDFTALNAQAAQLLSSAPVGIVASVEYRDGALQLNFKSPPEAPLQNRLRAQAVQQGLQLRFDANGSLRVSATGG